MRIVVLAGGISTERDVSLVSGSKIYRALKRNGHKVILLDTFLGYSGNPDEVFDLDIDWAEMVAPVGEVAPDIEEVKKRRVISEVSGDLFAVSLREVLEEISDEVL